MCEKTYSKTIYECGDSEDVDFTFTPCNDTTKAGHTVKEIALGSKRVKEECGKANCRNP